LLVVPFEASVARIEIRDARWYPDGAPKALRLHLTQVRIPMTARTADARDAPSSALLDTMPGLRELGYEELRFDADLDLSYERAQRMLAVRLQAPVGGFARFAGDCRLGFGEDAPDGDWRRWHIERCRLRIEDDGVAARLLRTWALRARLSPLELEEALALQEIGWLHRASIPSDAGTESALRQFAKNPAAIEFEALPANDIPFGDLRLYPLPDWVPTLGISARVPLDAPAAPVTMP
jgi:hypothetical protein